MMAVNRPVKVNIIGRSKMVYIALESGKGVVLTMKVCFKKG